MDCKSFKISQTCIESHFPLVFDSAEDAAAKFAALAEKMRADGLSLVTLELFAPSGYAGAARRFKADLGAEGAPVMHVLPLDGSSSPLLAGAHAVALKGADVEFRRSPKGSSAALYNAGDAEFCRILGVALEDGGCPADIYTEASIRELEDVLAGCGFAFSDVVRTWFFNRDILGWYDGFNAGRTRFFKSRGVFGGLLPASTGIGGPNPRGTRIQCGVLAAKGAAAAGRAREIPSPLQCGATDYGSSFSRAVEMDYPAYRRVVVSGTASIAPGGETLYCGDIDAQVDLTMRVIGGILESRGMGFGDVHRAVAYCMDPGHYAAFRRWCGRNVEIPHVPAYNTVCRSDLMFEVELDAAVEK